ncbi:hypothetical protein K458DRAFT_409648 [Lentithecium fluviatile CBS 122367]|uniref:Uncharacterized protein n=1 Tax=Lentithecium fluviatile CBS 122367 TaxID=1168545 RepID=A0A6G1IGR8_9PLEO|nr:hypothetical protein K458DRAFT_409648 [Lentithecium fluviatile CBS 122367]
MDSADFLIGDKVCILLGCDFPMILRPDPGARHLVVGNSFVSGLEDAKGLLGPLPEDVTCSIESQHSRWIPIFKNGKTDIETEDDPRLPAMDDWECLNPNMLDSNPYGVLQYKNKATREVVKGNPHLTPDALRARGVPIESIFLA